MPGKFSGSFVLFLICLTGLFALGQDSANVAEETAKIEAAIQSYVAAFNAKDVDVLTAHWSNDGVYTSRTTGEQMVGRTAMAESFKELFASENIPRLAVKTDSIDFISPNVALEKGTATVAHSEADVVESQYSVVYVKHDGNWLIDRVTEDDIVVEESHFDELEDLEWLVGDWTVAGDGFRVEFSCQWTTKQNFLSRKYTVYGADDQVQSSGLQVIGWDAKAKSIRSWLFDSDGGVVVGKWSPRDDGWAIQSVATLADGGSGSFTGILTTRDESSYGWKKINRVLDGKLLPNIDEIVVQRK